MRRHLLLILFFLNLTVIVGFWWAGSHSYLTSSAAGIFIATGRLFGLLGEFLILTQLVFIGRIQILERWYGFDRLNRYHQKIGWVVIGLLVFHPFFLSLGYGALTAGSFSVGATWAQFLTFIFTWKYVFLAFVALVLLLVIIGISATAIRKKVQYETWYFTHLLVYVVIALAFTHQIQTADVSTGAALYYWLVINFLIFGLVLVYRFLRPLWLFSHHGFYIERVAQETPTVWSVYITGRNLEQFTFAAGQFANLTFLVKGAWYSHPFSFSAAANGKTLRFSIKTAGDFTKRVPELQPGTKVIIDGPLGGFTLRQAVTDKFLFIAGGIGITPIRALVEELVQHSSPDMAVFFAVRSYAELAFEKEFATLKVPVITFLSDEEWPGHQRGFIDQAVLEHHIPDIASRDIYICGPGPMMDMTLAHLKALDVPHRHIHYERFNY